MSKKTIFDNTADVMRSHQQSAMRGPSELFRGLHETPNNFEASRYSLDLEPTVMNQIVLPLLESLVFGCFAAGGAFMVIVGVDSMMTDLRVTWPAALSLSGMAGFSAMFYRYLSSSGFYRDIIQKVENVTKRDINNDGYIGDPESDRSIALEITETGAKGKFSKQFADLPGPLPDLQRFAAAVVTGQVTFSEMGATKAGYGQKSFMKLREVFLHRGWARWKNKDAHTEGVELLRNGESVLRAIAQAEIADDYDDQSDHLSGRYSHIDLR
ncbi:MAG: hypothetical protein GF334_01895 [Candidatus Altiarchaeales archaeon]|nr:hypothetical protein [Candidatus Altiarchaeales archaeon]